MFSRKPWEEGFLLNFTAYSMKAKITYNLSYLTQILYYSCNFRRHLFIHVFLSLTGSICDGGDVKHCTIQSLTGLLQLDRVVLQKYLVGRRQYVHTISSSSTRFHGVYGVPQRFSPLPYSLPAIHCRSAVTYQRLRPSSAPLC